MPISSAISRSSLPVGMMPWDPTPTGMWSKSACASCSFTGSTSLSVRLVRMSRTPQLMSKPTPPGDTTASGSLMSKAATFPIANPYPECTSGSAIDLPTIPGSDATLAICFTAGRKPPLSPRCA